MWLVILILVLIGLHIFRKLFKIPRLSSLNLVTGGVKTGKSTMSVYFAIRSYKSALRAYKIKKFFSFIIRSWKNLEKPLLYSNVPLAVDYVPFTVDLALRNERFAYGSVIYIQEASLFADSMSFSNDDVNERLKLFNKLIAHETKGGVLIYDTQSCSDMHFSIKRSLQSYFYIHHCIKVPFFVVMYVREMLYSAENSGINNMFADDVEVGLRRVIVPKSVWKKFDCYTYSALTDDLPVAGEVVEGKKLKDLKSRSYVSIKK